jgi:hypothetical protein
MKKVGLVFARFGDYRTRQARQPLTVPGNSRVFGRIHR